MEPTYPYGSYTPEYLAMREPYSSICGYVATRDPEVALVRDGRVVTYLAIGAEDGIPVVRLHGTPGCCKAPLPPPEDIEATETRIIAIDRPGYGGSERYSGRTVADTARDVIDVMDALGYKDRRFGILANSGGTPQALGVAALYPKRVSGMILGSALSPDDSGAWGAHMSEGNERDHGDAREDPAALWERYQDYAQEIQHDMFAHLVRLGPELMPGDMVTLLMSKPGSVLIDAIAKGHREGLRQGGVGWFDDVIALHEPWGFNVCDIRALTILWHGCEDLFSSVAHTRWLADQIPNAQLEENPRAGHFGFWQHTRFALEQLRNWHIGPDGFQKLVDKQEAERQWIIDTFWKDWYSSVDAREGEAVDAQIGIPYGEPMPLGTFRLNMVLRTLGYRIVS